MWLAVFACSSQCIQTTKWNPHFQKATSYHPCGISCEPSSPHPAKQKLKLLSRLCRWLWKLACEEFSSWDRVNGHVCALAKEAKKSPDQKASPVVPFCASACIVNEAFAVSFFILATVWSVAAVACEWRKWLGDPYSFQTLEGSSKSRSGSIASCETCLKQLSCCNHRIISSRLQMEKGKWGLW